MVIHGRYEVGDVIGSGATADVRRGWDMRSGRPIAIKMLRGQLAQDPGARSRFDREATTMAGLDHPAVVSVYATGVEHQLMTSAARAGVPFIVMEYVAGRSLRDVLRSDPPSLEDAVRYQAGILAALGASHRAGVVHLDVKPANVMVTPEGAVKLIDFGIARDSTDPEATLTGAFLGTPSYVSPEQMRGESADARSDLYSAGCLLHELLTGRPPFTGDDPISVAYQHAHLEPARIETGIPALDAVVALSLAKAREDRFQSAHAFGDALLRATTARPNAHGGPACRRGVVTTRRRVEALPTNHTRS